MQWFRRLLGRHRDGGSAATAAAGICVDQMIAELIAREGGYVNDPVDRGGATRFGITLDTLSTWRGKKCTAADVKALKRSEAEAIYKNNYLTAPRINRLPSAMHPAVLDFSVHSGPIMAVKSLQRVANTCRTEEAAIATDGIIGPATIASVQRAIDRWGADRVVDSYCTHRLAFLRGIVERDPTQKRFWKGWEKRVRSFMTT